MKLIKKAKSKLLTKLFLEWVDVETDVELLSATKRLIQDRQDTVTGRTRVVGFKKYSNGVE